MYPFPLQQARQLLYPDDKRKFPIFEENKFGSDFVPEVTIPAFYPARGYYSELYYIESLDK
jgi:hypothetical protein